MWIAGGGHDPDPVDERRAGMTSGGELRVGRSVVVEMVRLAAVEVPGVLRLGHGGPRWRGWLLGSPTRIRVRDGHVSVRLAVIARPGQSLIALSHQVRGAVDAAIERLLGLEAAEIVVLVDGVG